MATKFKPWIDKADATSANANVETGDAFSVDPSRVNGFFSGDVISSMKVNTILRQASLINCALMEAFCPKSTLDLTASVENVKNELLGGIVSMSSLTALTKTVSDINTSLTSTKADVEGLKTTVNQIKAGTQAVGNAAKLGSNLPAYYQKKITVGTAAPSGGVDGDIYIMYS